MPNFGSIASQYANAELAIQVKFEMDLNKQGPDPMIDMLASQGARSGSSVDYVVPGDAPRMEEWKNDRFMSTLLQHKFNVKNKDYAGGIVIGKNQIDDDQLGIVMNDIDALARRAARFPSEVMTQALVNGFAGTLYPDLNSGIGFDSALFFSAAHSYEGGPTQSNLLSTAALNAANLEAADVLLAGRRSYDGKSSAGLRGTHLIVGPAMYPTAVKLVDSNVQINAAGTASGDNAYIKGRYTVVMLPEIIGTSANYWFLADLSKGSKPLIFQDRQSIQTSMLGAGSDEFFTRKVMKFGVDTRFGVGLYDWRTIVGSNAP